jgi:hypothetical protein
LALFKSSLTFISVQGIDGDLVDSTNFPLPNLRHTLRKLSMELHSGRGFCVIRDLEYEKYSVEDNMVIFLGIQSFIAETRARQDEKGNMIGDYESPYCAMGLMVIIVHIVTDDTVSLNPLKEFHTRHSKSSIVST